MVTPQRQRYPAGRKVLRSVQARAAVESVLVSVTGRNLAFPVRPEIPREVRCRWRARLLELRSAGWEKVQKHARMTLVEHCPWGLLGIDGHDKRAHSCGLIGCPSCHARKSAILADRILKVIDQHPADKLRLVRRVQVVSPSGVLRELSARLGAAAQLGRSYFREVTVEATGPNAIRIVTCVLYVGGNRLRGGKLIESDPLSVLKVVGRMRPYLPSNLGTDWDPNALYQARLLNLLAGVRLSSCSGACRLKGGAPRRLHDLAKTFLGPPAPEPVPDLGSSDCDVLLFVGDEGVDFGEVGAVGDGDELDDFGDTEKDRLLTEWGEKYARTKHLSRSEMLAEIDVLLPIWAANEALYERQLLAGERWEVPEPLLVEACTVGSPGDREEATEHLESRSATLLDEGRFVFDGEGPTPSLNRARGRPA